MTAAAVRARRSVAGMAAPAVLAVLAAVAVVGLIAVAEENSTFRLISVPLLAGGAAWLLLTRRYGVALGVLMLYVALVDGAIRLRLGYPSLTLIRDVLLYALVAGAAVRLLRKRAAIEWPPWSVWVLAFVAVSLAQVINPESPPTSVAVQALRQHLEWVPLFFLAFAVVRTQRDLRVFLWLLVAVAAVNGVVNFIQYNLTPEQLADWGPGYAERVRGEGAFAFGGRTYYDESGEHTRPFGLGADTGFGGLLGVLALPAALALLATSRRWLARVVLVGLSVLVVTAVLTSQQRTSILAAVAAVVAFGIFATIGGRGLRIVLAASALAIVGYGAISFVQGSESQDLFSRYSTITPGRLIATAQQDRGVSLGAIPDYVTGAPFGVGIGRSGPAAGLTQSTEQSVEVGLVGNSETEFNYLLSELGVPGLIIMLTLSVLALVAFGRIVRRLPDQRTRLLIAAVAGSFGAICVMWVSTSTTATTPLSPFTWFALGLAAYWSTVVARRG